MVLKTTVTSAPTEKRNLRLSADALTRLKQLAGDLELADFLRRMLTCVVSMAPQEWRQAAAARGNGHGPRTVRPHRRAHAHPADVEDDAEVAAAVHAGAAGLAVLAILLIGALVTLIVWLIWRKTDPPAPGPGDDPGGQLPAGPTPTGGA